MTTSAPYNFHILFIDDNPDDIEFYERLLHNYSIENRHYTFTAAETYHQALQLCDHMEFDVFLIDYNMREADGEDMLHALGRRYPGRAIPALILTGAPSQQHQAISARAGAMDYLVKDMHSRPEKIDNVIQKVIAWTTNINSKTLTPPVKENAVTVE